MILVWLRHTLTWADSSFRKGELEQCIEANLKAIALDPNLPMAHSNLGFAYLTKGDFEEAIEYSEKAVAIKPNLIQAPQQPGFGLPPGRADRGQY